MQAMSNDYVKIIIYAAAGHGKGLIDVMLSFGVKSILHRDVVGLIKRFLKARKCVNTSDLGTTKEWFTLILIRKLLTKEGPKKVKTIKGYMSIHLFRDQNSHGHRTLSDKKNVVSQARMYQNRTFCPALYHRVSYVENYLN